jgi:hypothetical protein
MVERALIRRIAAVELRDDLAGRDLLVEQPREPVRRRH